MVSDMQLAAMQKCGSSELLRLATAGSVDDGKSTLIGRLLFDSKAIFTDQLEAIERTRVQRGDEFIDLALLTDGLRAEREQGITIDVAYRYFSTPRRKFIIADTPGHVQYTRNMVTGASTADLAIILIDARKGVLEQTRRHAFLSSLLGIPHLTICVNKMDLVNWSQKRFEEIRQDFVEFAAKLNILDVTLIPVSALTGDNVVTKSGNMPWYSGRAVLSHLEDLYIAGDRNLIDARLPVQYVVRSRDWEGSDHRAYAGTIAGGRFCVGDEVVVLPGGFTSTVTNLWAPGGRKLVEATVGMAVTVELADDIDIARGDMVARPNNRPHVGRDLDALVCWFAEDIHLAQGKSYVLQGVTSETRAEVSEVVYRLDVNTLHRDFQADKLFLNEIGRLWLHLRDPIIFDAYSRNRETGSFILVDVGTNRTVAAGMITGPHSHNANIVWQKNRVSHSQSGATLWITGLSASGKSTVAVELERRLIAQGKLAYILDGDRLRNGLNADLGFSVEDRQENMRRTAQVSALFADAGIVVIVAMISPFAADRSAAREIHLEKDLPFYEIFMDTPLHDCEQRDPKGLYARARAGYITDFTGISSPYERPQYADIVVTPSDGTAGEVADAILRDLCL